MVAPEEVKEMVEQAFPNGKVTVTDMTGGSDHFEIVVVASDFSGKMLVEQHQMVQKAVKAALDNGRIHAIAIKTYTPEQWEKEKVSDDRFFNLGS